MSVLIKKKTYKMMMMFTARTEKANEREIDRSYEKNVKDDACCGFMNLLLQIARFIT